MIVIRNRILDFKDKIVEVSEGEFIIVPKGVIYKPIAREEVQLLMFVAETNVNTGNLKNELTRDSLERI